MKKIMFLAVLMFAAYSYAFALTVRDDRIMLKNARPMGMGGAFTAVADDENAVFYNPAGITQRKTHLIQFFDIAVKASNLGFWNSDYNNINDFDNLPESEQRRIKNETPNITISLINLHYISAPIKAGNNYVSFGAGFFLYGSADFKFDIRTSTFSANKLILDYDINRNILYNIPLAYKISSLEAIKMPGSLSLGMNLKYIEKFKAAESIYAGEYSGVSLDFREGRGFGMDLGMMYHFSPVLNFGLQISDIFTTKINYGKVSERVSAGNGGAGAGVDVRAYTGEIPPEVNIGSAYLLAINDKSRVIFAGDIRDLTNSYEDNFIDRLHLGAEYRYSLLALRLGLNSGKPTFGIGLESNIVQLVYAYYGENNNNLDRTDWFHEFKFSIKLGHNRGIGYGSGK